MGAIAVISLITGLNCTFYTVEAFVCNHLGSWEKGLLV